jgi:hypothetical protein
MTSTYNKLYNIWVKNENKVPATYGDVSLYSQAKADLNQITTTNLAINKNNTANVLDVSGNSFLTGRTDISGNLYVNNVEITGGGGNTFNNGIVVNRGSATYAIDSSGNSQFTNGVVSFSSPPTCSVSATTTTQLINKQHGDANYMFKTNAVAETITGIKTFQARVKCSNSFIGLETSDLINVAYGNNNYPQLTANNTISGSNSLTGANTFTNDGNTFNTTSSNVSITNYNFTTFTGYTTPVYPTFTTLLNGTQTTTLNSWIFTLNNASSQVIWSNGNNGLEYYGSAPPGYSYLIFMRAIAGSSLLVQQNLTFTAGKQYVMKFWSYWGYVNIYSGGSKTGSITLSIQNSTDTYTYNDQDTRNGLFWRQHTLRFSVSSTGSSYIRWTATDTAAASGTPFPWALGGITIREYNAVKLTDTSQSLNSFASGDFNFQRNLFTQNLYGTGDFGTSSGRGTFIAPSPNVNCLCINNNSFTSGRNVNNIAIGSAAYNVANGASENINIGNFQNLNIDGTQVSKVGVQNIQIGNYQEGSASLGNILIGNYVRSYKPTIGQSVAIGNQIGAGGTDNTLTGQGVGSRSVAIGYRIFSGAVDPFNRINPDYSVGIGWSAMKSNADYYNTGIGSKALENMTGFAGMIPLTNTTQFNTACGYQAGKNQLTLNRCCFFGANTDLSGNNLTDVTCLGYNARCGANYATAIGSGVYNGTENSVRIGRDTDKVYIDGGLDVKKSFDLSGNMIIKNGNLTLETTAYLLLYNTGIQIYDDNLKVGEWNNLKLELTTPFNANGGININGNAIEDLYVDVSNNQVIVGEKVFTANRTYFNANSFLTMDASKNIFMTSNNGISQAGEGNIIIGGTNITGSTTMTTSATNNTAIGSSTLNNLTSGRENQVYGYSSGASITTGFQNILGGFFSGYYITTGQNNVSWGSNCFNKLISGSYNSAFGDNAGYEAKTSSKCSFFGWQSGQDSSGNTYTESTALGAGATITASNQIVLGTANETTIPKGKLLHNQVYQNYYDNTYISSNTTLNFPCNEIYCIYDLGAGNYTITLPEITSASQLGARITFTMVYDEGSTIKFVRQGTNNQVMPKGEATGYTTAVTIISTSNYSATFIAVRHTTTTTNYLWRQI